MFAKNQASSRDRERGIKKIESARYGNGRYYRREKGSEYC